MYTFIWVRIVYLPVASRCRVIAICVRPGTWYISRSWIATHRDVPVHVPISEGREPIGGADHGLRRSLDGFHECVNFEATCGPNEEEGVSRQKREVVNPTHS